MSDYKELPERDYLLSILSYSPCHGLVWKSRSPVDRRAKTWNTMYADKPAGWLNTSGYRVVTLNGKDYRAHRLIWKMVTGNDPVDQIDHLDGDRLNNSFWNLREATNGQNGQNCKRFRNNTSSLIKGVYRNHRARLWMVQIKAYGVVHYLGYCKVREDAEAAATEARKRLHGEFARAA